MHIKQIHFTYIVYCIRNKDDSYYIRVTYHLSCLEEQVIASLFHQVFGNIVAVALTGCHQARLARLHESVQILSQKQPNFHSSSCCVYKSKSTFCSQHYIANLRTYCPIIVLLYQRMT